MSFFDSLKKKFTVRNVCILSIGFAVISLLVVCYSKGVPGNDFWWHVKVGEWICSNFSIPTTDVFSWYGIEHSLPWVPHEWLSDVVFYLVLQLTGELGIYLVSFGAAILMLILLWNEVKQYAVNNLLFSSIYFLILPLILHTFFYGRPHLFSFFLLFFELKCLYRFVENPKSKAIFFIPVISCLWSNFHGGSSNLAYLLCILFLIAGIFPENLGRLYSKRLDKIGFLKLLGVTVASIVAIVINPVGLDVLLYPYVNMGDSLMLSVITEWAAPDAKVLSQLILYFLPILLMTVGFLTENKKIRVIDVLVMLAFMFLFFRSVRFIMLWYIAAAFYAFRYMPEIKLKWVKDGYKIVTSVLSVFVCVLLFVYSIPNIQKAYTEKTLISEVMHDDMVDFIKKENPERLFNDYNFGETLIYNDIEVFFDARADVYAADNVLANGASLLTLKQMNANAETLYVEVDKLIDQYDFDALVIGKNRPLYTYLLSHSDKFECLYEDNVSAYFRVCGKTY